MNFFDVSLLEGGGNTGKTLRCAVLISVIKLHCTAKENNRNYGLTLVQFHGLQYQ